MELPEIVFDVLEIAVFAVFGLGALLYAFSALRVVLDLDYRLDTAAKLMDPERSGKVPVIFQQNLGRGGSFLDDEDIRSWEWGSREDIAVAVLDRAQLYLILVGLVAAAALAFLVFEPGSEPPDAGATSKTSGVEVYPFDHPCNARIPGRPDRPRRSLQGPADAGARSMHAPGHSHSRALNTDAFLLAIYIKPSLRSCYHGSHEL